MINTNIAEKHLDDLYADINNADFSEEARIMYRQIYDNATSLFTGVGLFIKENGGKHKVACLSAETVIENVQMTLAKMQFDCGSDRYPHEPRIFYRQMYENALQLFTEIGAYPKEDTISNNTLSWTKGEDACKTSLFSSSSDNKTNECIRRLKMLEVDESTVDAFREGKIPCYDAYGNLIEPSDEDKKNLKEIEADGSKVYAVIHSLYEHESLSNYLVVSKFEECWDKEFRINLDTCHGTCHIAYAYVISELLHKFPNYDYINVTTYHGLHRTSSNEARAYDDAPMFFHACRVKDIPSGITLASRIDVSVSEDERIYYNGKLNDNTAMYIWNGITMERIC